MRYLRVLGVTASLCAIAHTAQGQVVDSMPPRRWAVMAGVGNNFGWVGGQGERYFGTDRISAFIGVGNTPLGGRSEHEIHGLTFAGGVRGYTEGQKDRGFLEVAVAQVAVDRNCPPGTCQRHYGPTIQAGYQRVTSSGFTFLISWGIGYAPDIPANANNSGTVLGLGIGYTLRRRDT